jgi:hypothetical protein
MWWIDGIIAQGSHREHPKGMRYCIGMNMFVGGGAYSRVMLQPKRLEHSLVRAKQSAFQNRTGYEKELAYGLRGLPTRFGQNKKMFSCGSFPAIFDVEVV